jgi:hypothetical protein
VQICLADIVFHSRTCLHLLELPVHFDERFVVEELFGNVNVLQKAREVGALGEVGHATATDGRQQRGRKQKSG